MKRVLCINTGGVGNLHGLRMRRLTATLDADVVYHDVDRSIRRREARRVLWDLIRNRGPWDLIYQEGTGTTAGLCLIRAMKQWGQAFIVSSGDPVGGFFKVTKGRLAGHVFGFYERRLYQACTAFVGWTPYLTGAALHLGAKRAITVEGGVDLEVFRPSSEVARAAARAQHRLPPDAVVCGMAGSLKWTHRQRYCYGLELVEALKLMRRKDIYMLIVGDGDGRQELECRIPAGLRHRVVFTGRLAEEEVVQAINAMDVGFVTQTTDCLGNFRLTTKLPEYLACGVPVAMSPVPGFFDYVASAGWPLPVAHPASVEFHRHCADWLDDLGADEIRGKAERARQLAYDKFDYTHLSGKFVQLVESLLQGCA